MCKRSRRDTGIGIAEMEVKLESEGGFQKKNSENVSLAKHRRSESPVDDTGVSFATTICPAPLCRQFWKAGNYTDTFASKATVHNGKNYLNVHPMFLHSNATSHQWAFGAIAELLDNAVDEIQNGATFVIVDKIANPRNGSPSLLIRDDGGGMDPEAMRHCMSFGYSDKKSKSTIGQYGNGFKTSTMRLGADAIVFSRHLRDSTLTQSIGLLSYTFLSRTGYDRIVVPMVDYEFNSVSGKMEIHHRSGKEHFMSNLSMLLQWSPYSTEAELLQQFDDIGPHGTKVVIYNLWFSDDGNAELDFERDPEDIHISGDIEKEATKFSVWREQHVANRLRYSLRVYLSILYLRLPETFRIILRGQLVEHHNLANDLKFPEFILYIPKCGGVKEGQVITTIGFIKEAPRVNVHGFSIYHKNRLILPFWPVVNIQGGRGRGVVGVLEANFVEPTHNKQGFERTSLFQKLESRLKEMTWEYWDYHCGLLGYHVHVKSAVKGHRVRGLSTKRKEPNDSVERENLKRHASIGVNSDDAEHGLKTEPVITANQEAPNFIEENRKLKEICREYEKRKVEDDMKVIKLKKELAEVKCKYQRLLAEATALDLMKEEKR
ncbi:protein MICRORCHIDIA 6-like [Euphorbia lathyris]|uniref:protein MICRORCHIDIA 6-like n=1 Tax=Euphorbia lathyris TaxID=212925 RepID=UPI00331404FE